MAHEPCPFRESKVKSALVAVPEAGLRTYGRPTDCHFPAVLRASVRCNFRSQLPLRDSPGIEPGSLFNAPERGRTLEDLRIADCWKETKFSLVAEIAVPNGPGVAHANGAGRRLDPRRPRDAN